VTSANRAATPLVLWGKPGCHLCDVARPIVERVAASAHLALDLRSILDDDAAFAAYRYRIPVVTLAGEVLDEGNIEERKLRLALVGR
jgi:hypothetical protein